jgi:hypothetical protein
MVFCIFFFATAGFVACFILLQTKAFSGRQCWCPRLPKRFQHQDQIVKWLLPSDRYPHQYYFFLPFKMFFCNNRLESCSRINYAGFSNLYL